MSETSLPPKEYKGGCYCGAISYVVNGTPVRSAYCHCTQCQRLNGSPFIHTIHFPASAFSWTHPQPQEAFLDHFIIPEKPWKTRWRCKNCGCTVSSHNSRASKWSIWGAQLERDTEGKIKAWDELKPTTHIFYETRMLDINDGLDKWVGYENSSPRWSCA